LAIRQRGFLPHEADMRAGDLVLVAPRRPAWHQKRIVEVQAGSYDVASAAYTHAAVYLGDFQICEAVLNGVRVHSILDYLVEYRLLVRRLATVDDHTGYRIAIRAIQRLRRRYSLALIVQIAWQAFRGLHRGRLPGLMDRFAAGVPTICSALCVESIAEATQLIVKIQNGVPLPADLAATSKMVDVNVRWQRLSRRDKP
jgi:hypothetical protein